MARVAPTPTPGVPRAWETASAKAYRPPTGPSGWPARARPGARHLADTAAGDLSRTRGAASARQDSPAPGPPHGRTTAHQRSGRLPHRRRQRVAPLKRGLTPRQELLHGHLARASLPQPRTPIPRGGGLIQRGAAVVCRVRCSAWFGRLRADEQVDRFEDWSRLLAAGESLPHLLETCLKLFVWEHREV